MKQNHKLIPKAEQQALHHHQSTSATAREFANSDELLRFDSARTAVPPEIAVRLQKMSAHLVPPARPWWKAWLGGS